MGEQISHLGAWLQLFGSEDFRRQIHGGLDVHAKACVRIQRMPGTAQADVCIMPSTCREQAVPDNKIQQHEPDKLHDSSTQENTRTRSEDLNM